MIAAICLCIGLGAAGLGDYARPLGSKSLDQAALDAEGFGDKKALKREDDGLVVTLASGDAEAGWKTPQALRIGGDCSIVANVVVRRLPKPRQDDGVAIGLAVATQNLDQPDATLVREVEASGAEVFRSIDKPGGNPNMMQPQMMMFDPFGDPIGPQGKKAKPDRRTFPARGQSIRLEIRREGMKLHYLVSDDLSSQPREIGQMQAGPGDLMGVKLFASNRSGPDPVEVVFRDLTIHADRISGLGTAVRNVFGVVVHGDPTGIESNLLVVGGTPPTPPQPAAGAGAAPSPAGSAPMPAPASPPPTPPGNIVIVAPAGAVAIAAPAVAPAPAASPASATPAAPVVAPAMPSSSPQPTNDAAKLAPPPPPKAKIPFDEVESIAFERSSVLAGRSLGQPNVDTTGPPGKPAAEPPKKSADADDLTAPPPGTVVPPKVGKVEPKPNGIRDLHISLSGLPAAAIRQVVVNGQSDKGQTTWQLDTTGTPSWPLTVQRAGVESWADLFLEPPEGDCFDKQFTITVNYADGQMGNAQVKVTDHTNPKLALDANAPAPALDARIFLSGGEELFGKLDLLTEETLTLVTPWGDRLDVPMARVAAVYMGMPDHKESPEAFAKRLKERGGEDLLLARSKENEVVPISGIVEGVKGDKLTFRYREKPRSLPLKQVEGFVLASRPAPKAPEGVFSTFTLDGGLVVSGKWGGIEATTWKVETPWGQPLKLPAADVRSVRFRGGEMAYLSDLEPSKVEEIPYFGRKIPYRRDLNLDGKPLKLDGRNFEHGLAVHSRTDLTYDLDRKFATFEALVGFDESSQKKGRVDCRVFADGKEIYANPDLRADAPPVALSLPVAGAEQIRLVVDFGADEDTGDRVIWADARLYRRPPPAEPAKTATPKPPSGP